jgi:hypothetical protein
MKARAYLTITVLLLCGSLLVHAQQPPTGLNKKVSLSSLELRVDSLLRQLSRQSGVQFSFNSRRISPSKKVRFTSRTQTPQRVLEQLKESLGIGYKMVGGHVILVDNPKHTAQPEKPASPVMTSSGKKQVKAPQEPAKDRVPAAVKTDPAPEESHISTRQNVPIQKDSAAARNNAPAVSKPDTTLEKKAKDSAAIKAAAASSAPVVSGGNKIGKNQKPSAVQKRGSTAPAFLANTNLQIGTQGVGLSYETSLGPGSTIEIATGLGGSYCVTGKYFYYTLDVQNPSFYFSVRPKFPIGSKSGDSPYYWGLQLKYHSAQLFSPPEKSLDMAGKWFSRDGVTTPGIFLDVHAGYQKQFGERWRFNGHLGLGYSSSTLFYGLHHWYPAFGLKCSYRLKR